MGLGENFLRLNGVDRDLGATPPEPAELRREIEPWLSAVFQSEHLSLLVGNGLTTAVAGLTGSAGASMDAPGFKIQYADDVATRAAELATEASRGTPNIEDSVRAALLLVGGLEVLKDDSADDWRNAIADELGRFASSILVAEREIDKSIQSGSAAGINAAEKLASFLLSFASRAASRDRLNLFTTNYDRLIEYGCDLVGLRPVDRFVGGLAPRFRASRLDIDMHYNPPGIRGEPRYLEGVVRLTKLHGSVDWRYEDAFLRRVSVPFGAEIDGSVLASDAFESLIIYPNPAKDLETLEYPYAELFRDFSAAICRPNSALVTYGYGFGDDHINRVILDMLSIPSTHLVVISFGDPGDRIESFLERAGRAMQTSALIGPRLAALNVLVENFLPKPAMDVLASRHFELLRQRAAPGNTDPA